MNELKACSNALIKWVYQIYSIQIPFLNVSLWVFALTLFAISIIIKATDIVTHGSRSYNNDNNNNKIYKE